MAPVFREHDAIKDVISINAAFAMALNHRVTGLGEGRPKQNDAVAFFIKPRAFRNKAPHLGIANLFTKLVVLATDDFHGGDDESTQVVAQLSDEKSSVPIMSYGGRPFIGEAKIWFAFVDE